MVEEGDDATALGGRSRRVVGADEPGSIGGAAGARQVGEKSRIRRAGAFIVKRRWTIFPEGATMSVWRAHEPEGPNLAPWDDTWSEIVRGEFERQRARTDGAGDRPSGPGGDPPAADLER